jgi:hypothetical protein
MPLLLERIPKSEIDPLFVVTDTGRLEDGPELDIKFRDRKDGCSRHVTKESQGMDLAWVCQPSSRIERLCPLVALSGHAVR